MALLAAVLVVALATLLIAALLDNGEVTRATTRNMLRAEQGWQLLRGLEFWAKSVLVQDREDGNEFDARGDVWAQPSPRIPVRGGEIRGVLRDASGCFNLNHLHRGDAENPAAVARFERLLSALAVDPRVAAQAADWIDPDAIPRPGGAEDLYYLRLPIAHRAANRDFAHVSELRLLPAVSAKVYRRLRPLVCALPRDANTNLNFAPAELWMALDGRITETLAKRLARDGEANYRSLGEVVVELKQLGLETVDLQGVGTQSRYVRLEAVLDLDGIPLVFTSLIERDVHDNRVLTRVRGRM